MHKRIEFALHRTSPDETVFCQGLCLSSLDRDAGAVKREAFTVGLSDQLRMNDRGTLNASEYGDGKDNVSDTHPKVSIVLASSKYGEGMVSKHLLSSIDDVRILPLSTDWIRTYSDHYGTAHLPLQDGNTSKITVSNELHPVPGEIRTQGASQNDPFQPQWGNRIRTSCSDRYFGNARLLGSLSLPFISLPNDEVHKGMRYVQL